MVLQRLPRLTCFYTAPPEEFVHGIADVDIYVRITFNGVDNGLKVSEFIAGSIVRE